MFSEIKNEQFEKILSNKDFVSHNPKYHKKYPGRK